MNKTVRLVLARGLKVRNGNKIGKIFYCSSNNASTNNVRVRGDTQPRELF